MRYMTVIKDVDGLPRAWAVAPTRELAQERAEQEWSQRVKERTRDGTLDRSEERGESETTEVE